MEAKPGAQALDQQDNIAHFDTEFARLHLRSIAIIQNTPESLLYQQPHIKSEHSIGESVLRSAAAVEQTFGGINSNLWDDPFEWTLPEQLSTPGAVQAHLCEVENLRQHAFASFTDDACLLKTVAAPSGLTTLAELLSETLMRATDNQKQALSALSSLSGKDASGFII